MAVTISFTAETATAEAEVKKLQASITQSLSGIDAKMQDTARKTGQSAEAWRSGLTGMSQAVTRNVVEQGNLSKAFLQTGQAAQAQLNAFQRLQQQYEKTAHTTKELATTHTGMVTSLKNLAAGFGVVLSVQGLIGFTNSLVEAGLAQEKLMLTLKGATGSVLAAGEAYNFVRGVANQLGVDLQTSVEGFAKLTAATKDTAVQGQQTRDLFVAMSQASRVMGLSTAEVGGVMTALTQIIGKNTVSMEELRQQLGERLPSVLRLTAKEMGLTTGQFIEMVSKGQILATDFIPAVTRAFQTMGQEAPTAAASAAASLARVGNAWFELKVAIAQSGVLDAISAIAERTASAFRGIGQLIRGTQALQGTERITQLQTNLVTLTRQLQLAEAEGQRLMATGLRPEAAMSQTENLRTRIKAVADEITGIAGTLRAASEEEEAIAQKLKASGGQDATIKFLQERKNTAADLKRELVEINRELDAVRSKDVSQLQAVGLDPLSQRFEQQQKAQETRLLKARQDVQDKLEGIDRAGMAKASKAAESEAARRAKVEQQAMEQSLNAQEALIAQSFDDRRQLIDARFSEELAREPMRVKELSEIRSAELQASTVEEARVIEQARIESLARQHLTAEQFAAKREAIIKRTGEVELKASQQTLQQQVKDAEQLVSLTERVNAQIEQRDEQMQDARAREVEQSLQQQERAYEQFVDRVSGSLATIFEDLLSGTLNVLQTFKQLFLRTLSQIAAEAATRTIIVPIVGAVLGGIGGGAGGALGAATQGAGLLSQLMGGGGGIPGGGATGTGGGLLETGGLALTGIGLAKQLYSYLGLDTAVDFLGTGFKTLGESLLTGIDGIFGTAFSATEQAAQEAALLLADVTGDMGRGVAGAAGGGLGTAASVFGGAAAIAGGIYGALNATNNASRAAFAASAAAGTAALASTALVAAGVIAASSGWTGIGLIAAGVTAILGTIAEMVIKPEGPTLAVGRPSGLGIGVEGGQLAVSGDLGSRVMRRDKVDPGVARGVQAQMEEGITNAVISIVQTINAVALNPAALLGPTQDALQAALNNMKPLNSSNAKKMEQDITEQLRFINVQIVAGMLGPLNDAFNQLRDQGTLQEQLDRLPGTTAGLVQVFQTMNKQLEEIAGSKNTDVLRQLSGVRNQVENFGNRIAGTAGQIAEQIVDQIVTSMQASVVPTFTEQITQVSGLLNDSLRALETLRATQKTLEGAGLQGGGIKAQIDRLTSTMANQMGRISTEIVDQIVTSMQATVVPTLAGQIRQFAGLMDQSLQALGLLRGTQQALEGAGVSGGAVGGQIERLMQATSEQAGRISTDIVSGSLQSLAIDLQHVLVQPLSVQATTVSTLFNDSLAAMNTLVTQATRLETVGIDAGGVRQQIDRILGGMLDSIQAITEQSFATGNLTEFLNVLLSIPEALANLNPVTAQIRQMGVAFAQVAGPIQQVIDATSRELQTPEERATDASQRMTELRDAIAQTGDAIDQALPLYAQLGQAIQANAAAQIEVINQWADEQTQAVNEAYDIQLDAVRSWAEQATKETNDYVDAAQQAYADAFDAEIDKINAYTDAMMQAYEEMYDAQVKAVNTGFDAQIDALGSWVDVMTKGLQAWVETSTQMINDWADAAKTTASQVQTLNQAVLAELSPAQQRTTLESRRALFQERVRVGGPGAEQAMTELISINQQLLGLAKQSDNLALQKQATDELKRLQALMTEQLVAQTGQTDPVMAQIGVALEQERVLNLIAEGQRKQTEYITTTQKAEQEALEQRRAAQLDAIEVARTAILTEFERVRNNKIAELEIIRTHIQGQFEALRTAHLDEIEATRAAREVQLATDRDTQLKGIAYWQEEAVKAIKRDMVYQLQLVQYELQKLVSLQYGVITGTPLPLPAPPIAAQRGGLIGLASGQYYANGGLVRVMAEPGETYWSGHSASQDRALASVNSAFPRFASGGIVPGFGRGDTVPMWVAPGTRFVNRSASQAIGYADGGVVPSQGHSSHGMPSITIDLRGSTFANASDAHKVKDILEKDVIRIMEEYRRRAHVDTRIR